MNFGAMADGESDTFKRVLSEGNPYFLALTGAVSLLHSVFDALAFKNDIGFWRGKKNVEGLSVRTILLNAFCQVRIICFSLCFGWSGSQLATRAPELSVPTVLLNKCSQAYALLAGCAGCWWLEQGTSL